MTDGHKRSAFLLVARAPKADVSGSTVDERHLSTQCWLWSRRRTVSRECAAIHALQARRLKSVAPHRCRHPSTT